MIIWLTLIVGIFLLIASIIDLKLKVLPSIMLTAMLFVVAFLNPANLWFGAMAFIIAYLLMEADFFSGVADLKVMTMIGFMLRTTNGFLLMLLLVVCFGFLWKLLIKWRIKKEEKVAFIPVFLFVYLVLVFGGFI